MKKIITITLLMMLILACSSFDIVAITLVINTGDGLGENNLPNNKSVGEIVYFNYSTTVSSIAFDLAWSLGTGIPSDFFNVTIQTVTIQNLSGMPTGTLASSCYKGVTSGAGLLDASVSYARRTINYTCNIPLGGYYAIVGKRTNENGTNSFTTHWNFGADLYVNGRGRERAPYTWVNLNSDWNRMNITINYSLITPIIAAITSPIPVGNYTTNATNSINITAPIYYNWYINSTSSTLLKNDTGKNGRYFLCSSYPSCKAGSMIVVRARAIANTVPITKSNYSNQKTFNITNPTISIGSKTFFKTSGSSNINQYNATILRLNYTLTDDIDIYATQVNFSTGTRHPYNFTNSTLTGAAIRTIEKNITSTTFPAGTYTITILSSDSHTAKDIPDYQIKKNDKIITNIITDKKSGLTRIEEDYSDQPTSLEFETENKQRIKLTALEANTATTTKNKDRYNFGFTYGSNTENKTFYLESDTKIVYLPHSRYEGHFVVFDGKKGNWIDFVNDETIPIIEKITDYKYKITLRNNHRLSTLFNSIGGLNIVTSTYNWFKGNYTQTKPSALTNHSSTITLNITKSSLIKNIASGITYNGGFHNPTKLNGTNSDLFTYTFITPALAGNYNYTWNVSIKQADLTYYPISISNSQSVQNFQINQTNHTSGCNKTATFNLFDENKPTTKLRGEIEAEITTWFNDKNKSVTTYSTIHTNGTFYLCKIPESTNLSGDVYLKYNTTNGYLQRYYLFNTLFTNTSQTFSIYNFNDKTSVTQISVTTRYPDIYNYFKNAIGKLQRRYVSEGIWRTVQMDKSGDYGLMVFNIYQTTTDYRLIFIDVNNNVLRTTDTMKFLCTTCEYTMFLQNSLTNSIRNPLTVSYGYNNMTKNLTISWSNAAGDDSIVTTNVRKQTLTGDLTLCNRNSTGVSGLQYCELNSTIGTVLVTVIGDGEIRYSRTITVAQPNLGDVISDQEGAFWVMMMAVAIIGMGIISPILVVVATIVSLIVAIAFGMVGAFTYLSLAGATIVAFIIAAKMKQ